MYLTNRAKVMLPPELEQNMKMLTINVWRVDDLPAMDGMLSKSSDPCVPPSVSFTPFSPSY